MEFARRLGTVGSRWCCVIVGKRRESEAGCVRRVRGMFGAVPVPVCV